MQQVILILHIVLAGFLVLLILLQQGKGADAGAAFGAGASGTVFGSRGTGNFLSRTTAVLAFLFFCTSSYLAYFHARGGTTKSIVEQFAEESTVPVLSPEPGDMRDTMPDLNNSGSDDLPALPEPTAPGTTSGDDQ